MLRENEININIALKIINIYNMEDYIDYESFYKGRRAHTTTRGQPAGGPVIITHNATFKDFKIGLTYHPSGKTNDDRLNSNVACKYKTEC